MKAYFRDRQMYKTEVIGSVRVVYYPNGLGQYADWYECIRNK